MVHRFSLNCRTIHYAAPFHITGITAEAAMPPLKLLNNILKFDYGRLYKPGTSNALIQLGKRELVDKPYLSE